MSTLLASSTIDRTAARLPQQRIPALDGWRGIAILLVLFDHVQVAFLGHYKYPWMQTGQHGVTIFFVLSGFLITSKLIEGPIDIKQFYVRRFFRLMPAAWAYLAMLLFLNRVTGVSFTTWPEVRACVLFYRNMVQIPGNALAGHFWSLSLEEQFYLVWPFLLLLAGVKRCRWIAGVSACACALYRWLSWSHYDRFGLNDMTQVRADAVLIGCLMALLLSDQRVRVASIRWSMRAAIPALIILALCVARFHWLAPLRECVSIAILIGACVLHPRCIAARALSFAPLAWLGVISYSVYLWQGLFVHLGIDLPGKLLFLCIGLPASAMGSYYLIERPCTRFGYARKVEEKVPPADGAFIVIENA